MFKYANEANEVFANLHLCQEMHILDVSFHQGKKKKKKERKKETMLWKQTH